MSTLSTSTTGRVARSAVVLASVPIALLLMGGSASAHERGALTSPQPLSHADQTGHGANPGTLEGCGAYCSTRDGSPSLNGNGGGTATGKPCAGCVGKADNKNPKGQAPSGPVDHNNGYECDGNHGIGKGNPAHTACSATDTPPPVVPPVVPPVCHGSHTPPPATTPPATGGTDVTPPTTGGTDVTPPATGGTDVTPPVEAQGSTPEVVAVGGTIATATAPDAPAAPAAPATLGSGSTSVTAVTPAVTPTSLPFTGDHTAALGLGSLVMLAAGGGLLMAGRRR